MASTDVKSDNKPESDSARRVFTVECDACEMDGIAKDLDPDMLVEPARLRNPAAAYPALINDIVRSTQAGPPTPGIGAVFEVTLKAADRPVPDAKGLLICQPLAPGAAPSNVQATADGEGKLRFAYDGKLYFPALLMIEPLSSYQTVYQQLPRNGQVIELVELPRTGPLGWWHQVMGVTAADGGRGQGIRVGIVDTGVGPHPYLQHVQGLGAVTAGALIRGAEAALDVQQHGTHVAGIVGARPVDGSGEYAGMVPGAEIGVIRVFDDNGGATQGDIALAIDVLALEFQADVINLSLGGAEPSEIERDAVLAAMEMGSLCIASAGNGSGAPVYYPAAYPEVVAVGALGLLGAVQPGTIDAHCIPTSPAFFAPGGLFVANFSNVGPQLACSAPGVGIIAPVPARPESPAPYASANGTSEAAPLVAAALAARLAGDEGYIKLPRGPERITRASSHLLASLRWLGVAQTLAGYGLVTAPPSIPQSPGCPNSR